MKSIKIFLSLVILTLAVQVNAQKKQNMSKELATATFGNGCFWCTEAIFQQLKGVESVYPGYTGGHVKNPSYREVCTGSTGHAEAIEIKYDPAVISYRELLDIFFYTHDPTTLNRQGNDIGTQYRSAIFYHSEAQKEAAEKSKREVAPKLWEDPIVTEITEASEYYVAEDYHQNYFNENPNAGYCRVIINPKVKKARKEFSHLLKDNLK